MISSAQLHARPDRAHNRAPAPPLLRNSFDIWCAWAAQNCGIGPEHAWLYFETYDLVAKPSAKRRRQFTDITKLKDAAAAEAAKAKVEIDGLEFVLFLYIQRCVQPPCPAKGRKREFAGVCTFLEQ